MSASELPPSEADTARKQESRTTILDAAERLMAGSGYSGTSISAIQRASGLPPSSIYWHFGSKEGVLAAVMERGAHAFFAAVPEGDEPDEGVESSIDRQLMATADLLATHPNFLRLFYMLSLELHADEAVAHVIRQVRDAAIVGFRSRIERLLPEGTSEATGTRVASELAAVAVAMSDGIFFADHLEPGTTDVRRLYRRILQTVLTLMPILLAEDA